MTNEQDFQTLIDQDIDDWQTRLVFADWLEEQNDTRSRGYRELARTGLKPSARQLPQRLTMFTRHKSKTVGWIWIKNNYYDWDSKSCVLNTDLWNLLSNNLIKIHHRVYYRTRADAENAFARAYAIYNKPLQVLRKIL